MPDYRTIIDSIKAKIQARITGESSQEEIDEISGLCDELDSLTPIYDGLVHEQGELKDTVIRLVKREGNSNTPPDSSEGSEPATIEEFFTAYSNKQGGQ